MDTVHNPLISTYSNEVFQQMDYVLLKKKKKNKRKKKIDSKTLYNNRKHQVKQ